MALIKQLGELHASLAALHETLASWAKRKDNPEAANDKTTAAFCSEYGAAVTQLSDSTTRLAILFAQEPIRHEDASSLLEPFMAAALALISAVSSLSPRHGEAFMAVYHSHAMATIGAAASFLGDLHKQKGRASKCAALGHYVSCGELHNCFDRLPRLPPNNSKALADKLVVTQQIVDDCLREAEEMWQEMKDMYANDGGDNGDGGDGGDGDDEPSYTKEDISAAGYVINLVKATSKICLKTCKILSSIKEEPVEAVIAQNEMLSLIGELSEACDNVALCLDEALESAEIESAVERLHKLGLSLIATCRPCLGIAGMDVGDEPPAWMDILRNALNHNHDKLLAMRAEAGQ
eukprot:m.76967 g.76967  ORF g.76967 m.76967 type:complete len:350 (-) comp8125_c0_seq6:1095-2144(-)